MKIKPTLCRTLETQDLAKGHFWVMDEKPSDHYWLGMSVNPGAHEDAISTLRARGKTFWRYFRCHDVVQSRRSSIDLAGHVGSVADDHQLYLYANGVRQTFPWFGRGDLINFAKVDANIAEKLLGFTQQEGWGIDWLHFDQMFSSYYSWMSHTNTPWRQLDDYTHAGWRNGIDLCLNVAEKMFGEQMFINGESWRLDSRGRVHFENADNAGQDGRLGRTTWYDTLGRWLQSSRGKDFTGGHILGLKGGPAAKQQGALRGWVQEGGFLHCKQDETATAALAMRDGR